VLVFVLAVPGRAAAWTWPAGGAILRTFSFDRAHPYTAGQRRGIDIGGSAGGTVVAPSGGVVSFSGTTPGNGLTLSIRTGDGYTVSLTHLGSLALHTGATVDESTPVGTIGPSGTPELDVPYVHLGIRVTSDEQGYVDPLTLLPERVATPPPPPLPPPSTVSVTPEPVPITSTAAPAEPPAVPETDPAPLAQPPDPAPQPPLAAPAHLEARSSSAASSSSRASVASPAPAGRHDPPRSHARGLRPRH
jgi:hypothetical protein